MGGGTPFGGLKDYENIFEFDLVGFFDNVDLNYIYRMTELKMPKEQASWFRKLA